MSPSIKNPKVDQYITEAEIWQQETKELRKILLACHLQEEFKWNKPCYAFDNHNIVVLLLMKDSCALLFMKGALLLDADNRLVKPGENTNAGRQMRFTNKQEIKTQTPLIQEFIAQAIAIEKARLKVPPQEVPPTPAPEELQQLFEESPAFQDAFYALTPGRQRAYIRYFSEAKQSATRHARIEKYIPTIMDGKGLRE